MKTLQDKISAKLSVLKVVAFFLYSTTAASLVIYVSGMFYANYHSFHYFVCASIAAFCGLLSDVLCNLGISQIQSEKRQELILEELRRTRI